MYIRNFNQKQQQMLAFVVKRELSGLVRQYGVDEVLKGLEATYRETVFARAKSSEPVKHRATVLEVAVEQLNKKEVSAS
jgi:hypothetical protein